MGGVLAGRPALVVTLLLATGGRPLFSPLLAVETGQGFSPVLLPVLRCAFARAWVRVRTAVRISESQVSQAL
jgi:hypothetical protein